MESYEIYKDIAERTAGDIYIGVVGPVRTGKSTFIKRFMDLLVIPNIENNFNRERAKDELPQSAAGKTIMTTEPKFVPNEAVEIVIDDSLNFKVRMIDCVGYLVPGAIGYLDGDTPRMISTPWAEEKMPFLEAAELGTRKVITDHSTIGIVITTDGSITDISREDYIEAEQRVISELKALNKPFILLINTVKPYAPETEKLRTDLSELHGVPAVAVNCAQLKAEDISAVLEKILYEFPLMEIKINFPKWIETLETTHWLKKEMIKVVRDVLNGVTKLREVKESIMGMEENEYIKKAYVDKISLGEGSAHIEVAVDDSLFYRIISETTGMDISGEYQLISTIKVLAEAKREYDKVKFAMEEVRRKGYGIVTPQLDEMKLEQPVIFKHGTKYGVKMKASAPSIHIKSIKQELRVYPWGQVQTQSWKVLYIRGRGVFAGWVKYKRASRGEMACSFIFYLSLHGLFYMLAKPQINSIYHQHVYILDFVVRHRLTSS